MGYRKFLSVTASRSYFLAEDGKSRKMPLTHHTHTHHARTQPQTISQEAGTPSIPMPCSKTLAKITSPIISPSYSSPTLPQRHLCRHDNSSILILHLPDTLLRDNLDQYALEINRQPALQLVSAEAEKLHALLEIDVWVVVLVEDGEAVISVFVSFVLSCAPPLLMIKLLRQPGKTKTRCGGI